jgi:GT2 family glycosyltransferase
MMIASSLRTAATRIRRHTAVDAGPDGQHLSLASLRSTLDERSRGASWTLHADGVLGRALVLDGGAAVSFPMVLSGEVTFTARAMLLPHDWRDRNGTARAWVQVTGAAGDAREVWSDTMPASDRGHPRGHVARVAIPADTTLLTLGIDVLEVQSPYPLERGMWLEPAITDAGAPSIKSHLERGAASTSELAPVISVLVPVHDPPPDLLEEAIASIRTQTYSHWELCLVDDGSQDPRVISALQTHAASDPRIRLVRHDAARGISAATNAALAIATGQFIALLDHDDTLTADALQRVADTIAAEPDLDMIYSDEDVVGDVGLIERHVKPGWSPEHMAALMYTCHLGVYRRSVAAELGGFASRFDGCQDYDFVLRLIERTDRIAHLPRVLYHWRAHAGSTAGGDQAKPLAYLAQQGVIGEHLARSGITADVQFGQSPGLHRVVHRVDPSTSVDLVLAVATAEGLSEAASSWLTQPHPTWHLILSAPEDLLDTATAALHDAGLQDDRITLIPAPHAADPTAALTHAASTATAQHLLLMQTPAVALTHDWLTRLLGYSAQTGIAAAGPVTLAPDGRIQDAGIAIPDGIPLHLHYGEPARAAPPAVYNLSAVSEMLCTSRAHHERLGGLHPEYRGLTLIEYCLRAGDHGLRTVIVPDARLHTTGPDTTTNDLPALWHLHDEWATTHTHDPYYNPNYRTDRGDFVLRHYD